MTGLVIRLLGQYANTSMDLKCFVFCPVLVMFLCIIRDAAYRMCKGMLLDFLSLQFIWDPPSSLCIAIRSLIRRDLLHG